MRGQKGQYYEGGIRVPWCIKWPGHLKAGQKQTNPVIGIDLFPTIVTAAGGKIDADWKIDGVNLLPFLQGKQSGKPHETLYWKMGTRFAIRHGNFKLVKQGKKIELFDLSTDLEEKNDLAATRPETKAELLKLYQKWEADMTPPNFGWSADIGQRVENAWKWKRPLED